MNLSPFLAVAIALSAGPLVGVDVAVAYGRAPFLRLAIRAETPSAVNTRI